MTTFLKRNIIQRLFGVCTTRPPTDPGCWSYSGGRLLVDLERAPELVEPDGAVRIEGRDLPVRLLLIHATDDQYRAYQNKCVHAGRRLDPVPGTETVQCCSIGRTTYNYEGAVVHGSVEGSLTCYGVVRENNHIAITIE